MKTLAIALSLTIVGPSTTGIWLDGDGRAVEVSCPGVLEYEAGRLRLPSNCVAQRPGVWLSRDYYTDLEVKLAKAEARVAELEKQQQQAREEYYVCRNEVTSMSITGYGQPVFDGPALPFFGGAALGTLISLGGCALWTTLK